VFFVFGFAFLGVFPFLFPGPFDRLDWVFYWGDAVAFALLPPLLLHFTMVFPARRQTEPAWLPAMYVPALALGAARVIAVERASNGSLAGSSFSRLIDVLD